MGSMNLSPLLSVSSVKSVVGLPFSPQRFPRSQAKRAVNPCFSIIRFGPVSHFPTPSRAAFGSPAEFLSVLGRRHRHCGPSRYRKPRHCQRPGELFCSFVLSTNSTCKFPKCDIPPREAQVDLTAKTPSAAWPQRENLTAKARRTRSCAKKKQDLI